MGPPLDVLSVAQAMNAVSSSHLRSFLLNALLVSASITFALAAIEIGLRLVGASHRDLVLSSVFMTDPHCGFRLRPGAVTPAVPGVMPEVRINSLGMRDREHPAEKPAGSVRILALGDSFAYGRVAYRYNFLTLLESRLDAQVEAPVEALNVGAPAWQPVNARAYLIEYGFSFDPDLVLMCLYVGNDLRSNELDPTRIHPETPYQPGENNASIMASLFSWSELYWTVSNALRRGAMLSEIESRIPDYDPAMMEDPERIDPSFWMLSEEQYRHNVETQMRNHVKPEHWSQWDRENIENTLEVLADMAEACRDRSIAFAVALIPSEIQVHERAERIFHEVIDDVIDPSAVSLNEPQATLFQLLSERGIDVIDLLPAFQERGKTEILYLLRDTHWNEAGNDLAAEQLAQALEPWVSVKAGDGQ